MEQISFSDAEYSAKKKITRREKLLLEMEQIVPWAILLREIEPLYPVAGRGRRPYPCASMLRIHLMQHWFALSDPGMENALYEIESMRHFAGIKLNAVPDETTILNFRRFIEDNDLSIDILDKINQHLARKGLLLKTGTVVDATIIKAPCSTKNKTGGRDPEMHQTKKGNQWYFGLPRPASGPGRSIRFTRSNASLAIPRPGSRGWPRTPARWCYCLRWSTCTG